MVLTLLYIADSPSAPLIINLKEEKDELEVFCSSLHILSKRDKDKTILTVIRAVLYYPTNRPISATTLSKALSVNRITVLHHLKKLQKIGIIQKQKRKYFLVDNAFSKLVLKAKEETDKIFEELLQIAHKLDNLSK
ncbi:MAG: HTH domain-containing protein [Candidatus Micrarchaeota archaeon]|nr:HTH domain-containing protein [Candidatus Micrarchaeota archaeon]